MSLAVGQWLLLLLIGFLAGGYGVIVGAGGGFIIAPLLLLLFHLPPATAAGTSLTIVFLSTLSGAFAYARQQRVNYRTGLLLSLPAVPGALVGAAATRLVSQAAFRTLFGILILGLAVYMAIHPEPKPRGNAEIPAGDHPQQALPDTSDTPFRYRGPNGGLVALGIALGFVSSFFGIGAGWLVVPLLVHAYRFPTHVASATSIFSLCVYSAAGVFAHSRQGNVLWPAVVAAGLGVVVSAQIAAHLSRSLKGANIIRLLALALGVVGVVLLLR